MVDDNLTRQLHHHVGSRSEDIRCASKQIWPLVFQPEDFWANRLRGQRIAAAVQNGVFANLGIERVNLSLRAGIDAVEDPVHQRRTAGINGQHTGANCGTGHCADLFCWHAGGLQELPRDTDKVAPPVFIGTVFGPTGLGYQHFVRVGCLRDNCATAVHQNALGFKRANIDTKRVSHG